MAKDLSVAQDVVKELFDPDAEVRDKFSHALAQECMAFAESFANAFFRFNRMQKDCGSSKHAAIVCALIHGVLDDCLISVKALLSGKLSQSGNSARQSAEGICMAIMAVQTKPLAIWGKELEYWELIGDNSEMVYGHRAGKQLLANRERLSLAPEVADQFVENIEIHHVYSHAGPLAWAARMDLKPGGFIYFGGHFDEAKVDGYRKEMQQRIALCKWAVLLLREMEQKVRDLPKDEPPLAA